MRGRRNTDDTQHHEPLQHDGEGRRRAFTGMLAVGVVVRCACESRTCWLREAFVERVRSAESDFGARRWARTDTTDVGCSGRISDRVARAWRQAVSDTRRARCVKPTTVPRGVQCALLSESFQMHRFAHGFAATMLAFVQDSFASLRAYAAPGQVIVATLHTHAAAGHVITGVSRQL